MPDFWGLRFQKCFRKVFWHGYSDLDEFDKSTLSFTYGDSHTTFSPKVNDGKEYRKKLYTYDEILGIIAKYGYP